MDTTWEQRDKLLGVLSAESDATRNSRFCPRCAGWFREYDLTKTDEYECRGGESYVKRVEKDEQK
jgi:hypothetical protein